MSQELNSFVIFTLLPPCCFGHLGQAEDDEGSAENKSTPTCSDPWSQMNIFVLCS